MSSKPIDTAGEYGPSGRVAPPKWESYFESQIEATRRQIRWAELAAGLLLCTIWIAAVLCAVVVIDGWLAPLGSWARWTVFLLMLGGAVSIAALWMGPFLVRRISAEYAAKMIEDGSNGFHNSLLSYVFLRRKSADISPTILHSVGQRAARDLSTVSPLEKVDYSRAIQLGFILLGILAALGAYALVSPKSPWPTIQRILFPGAAIAHPATVLISQVNPGDTEVFYGQKLLVTADVRGRHDPQAVKLVYSTLDGQQIGMSQLMKPEGDSHRYQFELATAPSGIQQDLIYWIEVHDGRSVDYRVTVRANPAIAVQSLDIAPPPYTELPPRRIEGRGDVEGPDGSSVTLVASANLPVDVAVLELLRARPTDPDHPYDVVRTIELTRLDEHSVTGLFHLVTDTNRERPLFTHYQVKFRAKSGHRSEWVNVHPIRIIPDLPPDVKIVRPTSERVGLPLNRELEFEVVAMDRDYQLSSLHLVIDHQGSQLLDQECPLEINRNQQQTRCHYRLNPVQLGVKPGDELIVYARAADNRHSIHSEQLDPNISRSQNIHVVIEEPSLLEPPPAADSTGQQRDPADGETGDSEAAPGDAQQQPPKSPGDAADSPPNQEASRDENASDAADRQETPPPNDAQRPPQSADQNQQRQGDSTGSQQSGDRQPPGDQQQTRDQQQSGNQQQSGSRQQSGGQEQSQGSESGRSGQTPPSSSQEGGQADQQGTAQTQQDNTQRDGGQAQRQSGEGQGAAQGEGQSGSQGDPTQSDGTESQGNTGGEGQPGAADATPAATAGSERNPSGGDPGQSGAGGNEQLDPTLNDGEQTPLDRRASDGERMERLQELIRQQQGQPDDAPSQGSQPSAGEQQDPAASEGRAAGSESGDSQQGGTDATPPTDPTAQPPTGEAADGSDPARDPGEKSTQGDGSGQQQSGEQSDRAQPPTDSRGGQGDAAEDPNREQSSSGGAGQAEQQTGRDSDSTTPPTGSGRQGDPPTDPREGNSQGGSQQQDASQTSDRQQQGGGNASEQAADRDQGDTNQPRPGEETANQNATDSRQPPSGAQGERQDAANDNAQTGGRDQSQEGQEGQEGRQGQQGDQSQQGQEGQQGQQSAGGGDQSSSAAASSGGAESQSTGGSAGQGTNPSEMNPGTQSPTSPQQPGGATSPSPGQAAGPGQSADPGRDSREDLEYSRRATELVLEYLRQQEKNPDPKLLEQMNWSEEDLRDFLRRWEEMKAKAGSDPQAKRQYEEALQGLGLRPPGARAQSSRGTQQGRERLAEDGAVIRPPADYAEQFNAFMKNVNRLRDDQ